MQLITIWYFMFCGTFGIFRQTANAAAGTKGQMIVKQSGLSVGKCGFRVVGYYTSFGGKKVAQEMLSRLTHVNYAFPDMGPNGSLSMDGNSTKRLQHLIKMRGNDASPKILLAIGGQGKAELFDTVLRSDRAFDNFTVNLKRFVEQFNLDGVDIDYEHPGKKPDDKTLYVQFMRRLRKKMDSWKLSTKKARLLLTFAAPAGSNDLRKGYDLKNLLEGDTIDWVNVMAYDYYGPWDKETGPPAPLFAAAPANYSKKLNVHWTMEQYACAIPDAGKIVLGVPFYGRFWYNVTEQPVNNTDPMWRVSSINPPKGGEVAYADIQKNYLDNGFVPGYNAKAQAPFAWNAKNRTYLGYETPQSLEKKVEYALQAGFGGLMIWALDQDDANLTLLHTVTRHDLCAPPASEQSLTIPKYYCQEPRWWSNTYAASYGTCGTMAPPINGYYPVCDPRDERACCNRWGYCTAGPTNCKCPECNDYAENPEKIWEKSVKPITKEVLWFTLDQGPGLLGRCGYNAPRLLNGGIPICNPDDPLGYCCSSRGVCGNEPQSCNCSACVNFRKTPNFRFKEQKKIKVEKTWWTWDDSPEYNGRCGPHAAKINGTVEATCDPQSANAYCCSSRGFCGAGKDYCTCNGCTDYRAMFL
ncbi:acidic mammalian chitinase-like [Paramacrobiotus metropolitanus]|uniref:acidic mammalian chitinase-like n=1 Tax=Paramacrobiotus metropolitanus TaxID=2943436 RepID=UPI002446519A|nr:acidic mammalian chitinase-like [Paramacrobiotus metropolitanus]